MKINQEAYSHFNQFLHNEVDELSVELFPRLFIKMLLIFHMVEIHTWIRINPNNDFFYMINHRFRKVGNEYVFMDEKLINDCLEYPKYKQLNYMD